MESLSHKTVLLDFEFLYMYMHVKIRMIIRIRGRLEYNICNQSRCTIPTRMLILLSNLIHVYDTWKNIPEVFIEENRIKVRLYHKTLLYRKDV